MDVAHANKPHPLFPLRGCGLCLFDRAGVLGLLGGQELGLAKRLEAIGRWMERCRGQDRDGSDATQAKQRERGQAALSIRQRVP